MGKEAFLGHIEVYLTQQKYVALMLRIYFEDILRVNQWFFYPFLLFLSMKGALLQGLLLHFQNR